MVDNTDIINSGVTHKSCRSYQVRQRDSQGTALFACTSFTVGELVILGLIPSFFLENFFHTLATKDYRQDYRQDYRKDYPKHSCQPNCGIALDDAGGYNLVAFQPISPNDELTIDYAMVHYAIEATAESCACQQSQCRGQVTGWKDLPNSIKQAYQGFAAPYLLALDKKNISPAIDNNHQASLLLYDVTHTNKALNIAETDLAYLLAVASWQQPPEFFRPGVVAEQMLAKGIYGGTQSAVLMVSLIKGAGFCSIEPSKERHEHAVFPPSEQVHCGRRLYFGVNQVGEYATMYRQEAPLGGLTHQAAVAEYQHGLYLHQLAVPVLIPLLVIRYHDLFFDDKPMGAVISLSMGPRRFRLDEVLYLAAVERGRNAEADQYYQQICLSLGLTDDPGKSVVHIQAVALLAKQIGQRLRQITDAGLYGYLPKWSNFAYDFSTKQVLLTELSTVAELSTLAIENRPLQVLFDIAVMVYHLVSKFAAPSALDHYQLKHLQHIDPLTEILTGYFSDLAIETIRPVARQLWNAIMPHLFLLKKYRVDIQYDWSNERRRSYKMDFDFFVVLAITVLHPLVNASNLAPLYPAKFDRDELMGKAKSYLGEDYDYFHYLLTFNHFKDEPYG